MVVLHAGVAGSGALALVGRGVGLGKRDLRRLSAMTVNQAAVARDAWGRATGAAAPAAAAQILFLSTVVFPWPVEQRSSRDQ